MLSRKPGALAGSTALAAARTSGVFTADHQLFWDAARRRLGDGAGTRALVGVLLLHRILPAEAVIAGMMGAAALDSVDPLVAVEARRADHPRTGTISAAAPSLLADHDRPAPSLAGYDQLLTGASA